MEQTSEEQVEDICRSHQLRLVAEHTTFVSIFLSRHKSRTARSDGLQQCRNVFFIRTVDVRPEWLGYSAKEEMKTPNIGIG